MKIWVKKTNLLSVIVLDKYPLYATKTFKIPCSQR